MTLNKTDLLSELPNHLFFNEILRKSINHAKRHHQLLGILFVYLQGDNNNATNLCHVAARLCSILRTDDILTTLPDGGFAILLANIGHPKFMGTVAEKINKACNDIPVHVGISIYPNDGESFEALLSAANAAAHNAALSHPGIYHYQFHSPDLESQAKDHVALSQSLRDAFLAGELKLYYQPKMNLKQGSMSGVEALIRWQHPTSGFMDTGSMIKLAEETGLIVAIGEWAIKEACLANKRWQNQGYEHLTIGVNVSPKQFYDANFATKIKAILDETQLNPEFLELEINEATVMGNMDNALKTLQQISALGVKITIDHFGVGYTSISHLKLFPINHLKIDHSFIKGLPQVPNDIAIVNAFIALAHHLGFEVIAEGVETAEQMQFLSTQGCDIVQGYFLSEPQPDDIIQTQFKKIIDEVLI